MKKIYVVVLKKDVSPALEALRELESVHVEHQEPLNGFQLEERREEVEILENAIAILKSIKAKEPVKQQEVRDWTEAVNTVLEASSEAAHYSDSVIKRQVMISRWEPWGHFDLQAIRDLAARGVHVQLCAVPKNKRNDVPQGVALETIYSSGGVDYCVAVSAREIDLPFERIALPEMSLKAMLDLQKEERDKINRADKTIKDHLCYLRSLEKILLERKDVLRFEEVEKGMLEHDLLVALTGYCPADRCGELKAKAQKEQWALLVTDPGDDNMVPTLVRNPRWVEIIKPMFAIMNIVPGYKEKDISPFFLVFFAIFFGMLVGDAGYGAIFLALTALGHKLAGPKVEDKSFFFLGYVLSSAAIVWGVLTGTIFGTLLFAQKVKPLLPWLTDTKHVTLLCFILGVIHLTIAHLWRCATRGAFIGALAEIGWILMLWGSFFLANMMLIGIPLPWFVQYLYIAGGLLVILDIIAQKKDIGVNMILFIFSVINTFGDIVSYIRLFAVGLAGVAVADAFNQMALGIGFGNPVAAVGAVLVLAFVHLFLNLALCVMGVLVHGVRLNVLEFSGHLGMEWSGIKYQPFKRESLTDR